ncbi:MAG: ketopantoate reductase family protein [Bacillota bacterium]|nr:ketopantoate reductase family protein [Bacillota bacterium]
MEVLLYGCGAVGLGIAASIYDAGLSVDFVAKGRTKEAIRNNGIVRSGIFKEVKVSPEDIVIYEDLDEIKNKQYDYVLVCTKSTSNSEAAENLKGHSHILKSHGKIVIFQNGWGNDEAFLQYFSKNQIFSGRVITGFSRPERYISEVTVHSSPVLIGSLHGEDIYPVSALAEAIDNGGIPCEITDDIEKALWAKMLYNCTLNPLGAVLGVSYGKLTESENSIFIMDNIIEEIFKVMSAAGYHTYWQDAAAYKRVFYGELIPDTYRHRSSTLQDMERKIKTEIENLNASVVRLGSKYGIPVPYNTIIYNMIKAMESFF